MQTGESGQEKLIDCTACKGTKVAWGLVCCGRYQSVESEQYDGSVSAVQECCGDFEKKCLPCEKCIGTGKIAISDLVAERLQDSVYADTDMILKSIGDDVYVLRAHYLNNTGVFRRLK